MHIQDQTFYLIILACAAKSSQPSLYLTDHFLFMYAQRKCLLMVLHICDLNVCVYGYCVYILSTYDG